MSAQNLTSAPAEDVKAAENSAAPANTSAAGLSGLLELQTLPVRAYLDATVVPLLLQGLAAIVKERPANPVEYLGHFLLKNDPSKSSK